MQRSEPLRERLRNRSSAALMIFDDADPTPPRFGYRSKVERERTGRSHPVVRNLTTPLCLPTTGTHGGEFNGVN